MKEAILETTYALKFTIKAGSLEISTVNMKCPCAKHMSIVSKIDELVMKAKSEQQAIMLKFISADSIAEMAKNHSQSEDVEENQDDAKEIIKALKQTSNFSDFSDAFKQLITSNGICSVDHQNGSQSANFGSAWYDLLNVSDVNGMMEKYLDCFFIQ